MTKSHSHTLLLFQQISDQNISSLATEVMVTRFYKLYLRGKIVITVLFIFLFIKSVLLYQKNPFKFILAYIINHYANKMRHY